MSTALLVLCAAAAGCGSTSDDSLGSTLTETPVPADYWPRGVDLGPALPDDRVRALVALPTRRTQDLVDLVINLYDPSSPQFRRYLSQSDYQSTYAPSAADLRDVQQWLVSQGMTVERVAKNGLLIEYSGTVQQWNAAFHTQLHVLLRKAGSQRPPAYAPAMPLDVPMPLVGKIRRLLMPDRAAATGVLAPDAYSISKTLPKNIGSALMPAQLARAYELTALYDQGLRGGGTTLGIVGATLHFESDLQSMWQAFGITRKSPRVNMTMEQVVTHDAAPTSNLALGGALAPEASLLYFAAPDSADTSLVYTLNEAVAADDIDVVCDSFAHAESNTPAAVARTYNESLLVAAARGITVVASAGDSAQVDIPSDSPYITAVGGTTLTLAADGSWSAERGWGGLGQSGCGASRLFAQPGWQGNSASHARMVTDVAVSAGPLWMKYLGSWDAVEGTAAAAPVFAAMVALLDQHRQQHGKPRLGYLNPLLYQNAAVRSAFRDLLEASPGGCPAGPGYDLATGIGSPMPQKLAVAFP